MASRWNRSASLSVLVVLCGNADAKWKCTKASTSSPITTTAVNATCNARPRVLITTTISHPGGGAVPARAPENVKRFRFPPRVRAPDLDRFMFIDAGTPTRAALLPGQPAVRDVGTSAHGSWKGGGTSSY